MVWILSKLQYTQSDQFYFTTFMVNKAVAHDIGSWVDTEYDAIIFQCLPD